MIGRLWWEKEKDLHDLILWSRYRGEMACGKGDSVASAGENRIVENSVPSAPPSLSS